MKNKRVFLLLVISIFFIQCKKRDTTKIKVLAKKEIEKKINSKVFLVEGIYFPEEYGEDCDFWLKINLKNDKEYLYTFFNGSKIKKTGKLFLKNNHKGDKQLIFDNEFKCAYSKDTILIQNYGNSMNYYEHISYCNLKFINLVKDLKMENENLTFYNNKAYYLEQSGLYEEAIYILKKIVEEFPYRTVAYINLGDAYWGLGKKEKARQAYKTYVKQMKANGKEPKIPKQVLKRVTNEN